MDELVRKRKRIAITTGVAALASYILMFLIAFLSGYANLGYGSINNTVVTLLIYASIVLVTVALITWCRLRTPKSGLTSWKRVGVFALVIWGGAAAFWGLLLLGTRVTFVGNLGGVITPGWLTLIPSLVWFPIWTAVAAIRGARSPERVAPRRAHSANPVPVYVPPPASPVVESMASAPTVPTGMPEAVAAGYEQAAVTARKRSARKPLIIGGIVAGAVLLLALAAVGLFVADQQARAAQYDAVLDVVEKSEEAMATHGEKEDAVLEESKGAVAGGSVEQAAVSKVKDLAGDVAVQIGVLRSDLDEVSVSGWHPEVEKLRDDYRDHMDAWLKRYEGVAAADDWQEMSDVANAQSIPIRTTWEIAGQTAREGMPNMFAGDLPARVQAVFFSEES